MLKLIQYLVYPKETSQTQTLNNRLLSALLWAFMFSIPFTLVSLAIDWPSGNISHGTSLLALLTILIDTIGGVSIGKMIRSQDPSGTFKHQNATKRWLTLRATAFGCYLFIFFFFFMNLVVNPLSGETQVSRLPINALFTFIGAIIVGLLTYVVSASIASDKRRSN